MRVSRDKSRGLHVKKKRIHKCTYVKQVYTSIPIILISDILFGVFQFGMYVKRVACVQKMSKYDIVYIRTYTGWTIAYVRKNIIYRKTRCRTHQMCLLFVGLFKCHQTLTSSHTVFKFSSSHC